MSITVVIRIAIVEFLEVVEIRVTHREALLGRDALGDGGLDLHGARQSRRRMHHEVAIRPPQHRVHADQLLRLSDILPHDFVGARLERAGETGIALADEHNGRHDRGIGVLLDATAGGVDDLRLRARIERHYTRPAA